MTTSDPSAGRSLRLLIELGRGGMGVVYLALAEGPGGFAKLKVVKRLRPDLAGEPQAVQMFLEEGRLSARLHHPNVVQTNEVGFDGKHYFLEMEYLEGQSLDAIGKRAARTTTVPLPIAVFVLAQTLIGLHYAHELVDHDGKPFSVVHRDVSPHNVMVTFDGQVKVLDFGIAKAAGQRSETKTGFVKGKVTYMAPEQVARKPLDRRVDVFAVGVMLWEALTGARLWGDLDDFEIFLKLRSEDIPAPRSVKPDAPEALEAICMRALARDPEGRYATAADMQRDLEGWLETTGSRVGTREVAAQMDSLFAVDRASIKAEIDDRIRATPAAESVVGVPMLQARVTGAAATASGVGTASTVGGGTRIRQQEQIKGLRKVVIASLGVALVASVAAAGVTIRNRRARSTAAAVAASSSASSASAAGGCLKNAECGKGEVCSMVHHSCVALATDKCSVLAEAGDVENERTIWIGAMFPTTGPEAELYGVPSTNAVNLVRRDFIEATRGIPSHASGGAPRPFAVVACNDVADEKASARHLVEDVGIAAVIGFKSSSEAIELSRDFFLPRRVFVAAVSSSAQVTQVPQPPDGPRLIWRTTAVSTQNAVPAAHLVSDLLEPRLRSSGSVTANEPIRVAFARPRSQYGLSMAEAIADSLSFNGRPARSNGENFAQLVYDDDPYAPGSAPDYDAMVAQLVKLAPQVIIYADQERLVANVIAPVERAWPAKVHRPFWISVTDLAGKELFAFLGKDAERRRRFLGVSTPETSPANAQLAMHYSSEFTKMTPNETPAAAYDAAYLVAYAAYAAGDAPPNGSALATAITHLIPPGNAIDVGSTHIFEVIEAIRRGANVDLGGANTRLDFDLASGETTVDWVIQCVGVDTRGVANDAVESGVTYDPTKGKLRGELRCP